MISRRMVRDGGALRIERRSLPELSGDQVALRMLAAAVCGTDRQILQGVRPDRARVLGHEGVAEVAQTGAAATLSPGGRYVFNPVHPESQDEILGHSTEGIFQDLLVLPQTELERRQLLVPVAEDVDVDLAVLAEPLGTVVYTHEIARSVASPGRVLVVGAGPMGLLHAGYAVHVAKCSATLVCRSDSRRAVVPSLLDGFGAVDVVPACPEGEFDLVVLCTPAPETGSALRAALPSVVDGGVVALVGGIDEARMPELPGLDLKMERRRNVCGRLPLASTSTSLLDGRQVHVYGHRGTSASHLRQALAMLVPGSPFEAILGRRVELADLPAALTPAVDGSPQKVAVSFEGRIA